MLLRIVERFWLSEATSSSRAFADGSGVRSANAVYSTDVLLSSRLKISKGDLKQFEVLPFLVVSNPPSAFSG